jgi:glyoxylase-like metal-dependent hydrolase (beta-lactamase superfamily II)
MTTNIDTTTSTTATDADDRELTLDATESWQIGRVTITKFVEMAVAIPGEMMMPEATAEVVRTHREELGPHATDEGLLTFGVHGFVLDDGERRILVDGGIGNAKSRPEPWFDHLDTPALATMAAAGYPVGSIDTVVATHIHADHVGWFTVAADAAAADDADRDAWVPTFANARHLVVRDELAHWQAFPEEQRAGTCFTDSVDPVLLADLIDPVAPDHAITDEIRLIPTPGHSPGHVSVLITSAGESAVITGDLLHQPIQVLEPDWDGPFDDDTVVSAATRKAFLARFADTATLVLGTHVPTPTAGRIVTTTTGWRWVAAPS